MTLHSRTNPSTARPPGRASLAQGVTRAAFAAFVAEANKGVMGRCGSPGEVAARLWPEDVVPRHIITRSAVNPATMTDQAWAGVLVQEAVGAFLASLAPMSAAARLMEAGQTFPMEGHAATLTLPYRAGASAVLPWVAEDDPIPARAYNLGEATLGPVRKMGAIAVLSYELAERTAGEAVLTQLLREDAADNLDAAIFNNLSANDARAAGVLHGVTPFTATAGGGLDALKADLLKLVTALATAGGSGEVAIVANPLQAGALPILWPEVPYPIWPSLALPAGRVVVVDRRGFVSGFGPEPDVEASSESTIVMDTAPAQVGTPGAPPVVAPRSMSMFQTGQIGVRVILDVAFALRRPGLAQWVEGVTW